jgi:SAM-dependent methyltransferase
MEESKHSERNWQLEHYANVGEAYGKKHFTQAESPYTTWILEQIASVRPGATTIAEVGAGTCVFASLLGKKMHLETKVVCYEPVKELLEGATAFDNIRAVCGGAIDFARGALDDSFDLIFTKDTAHHFAPESLDEVHRGFLQKLKPGGRYLMVVRTPPENDVVPVGRIASSKWTHLYTPLADLLTAMRNIADWKEIQVTRWEKAVGTQVKEWIDGVRGQDTWSVFSALAPDEIAATIQELEGRFAGASSFDFLHQYDIAVFEKPWS